jgi:EAL domain-containing protein (putative c-di-GMP-specific phosphodiesterase class I)
MEADNFQIYCKQQPDYHVLLARLQDKVNGISDKVNIRLRMGVKPWQKDMEPVMMFDGANAACNMARGNFNDPLRIYDDEMREKEMLNQRLLNDLRAAEEKKQFRVVYQPKYDIQCDPPRLASAEALIRWQHPELGLISPGQFVPLFEGNGLIGIVDNFVWEEAARQVAEWQKKYGLKLPVSVNMSRSDLFDPAVTETLKKLIEDNGLDFTDLKLEITETAYTDNAREVLRIIGELRGIGFEIEMDDFGTGYSSLNMLSDMPIDVLKMDMRFIRNIETSETDRKLVSLILDIAKYLDVPVVAEGVEAKGQLDILKGEECKLVQGYFFSKPLPPEEFEELIKKEITIKRQ